MVKASNPTIFDQRIALVTGGSAGIGAAIAERLAAAGAEVVLVARSAARLKSVADRIRAGGGKARVLPLDLAHSNAPEVVRSNLESLDFVINNAGYLTVSPIASALVADWRRAVEINLLAPMALVHALLPLVAASETGHIITVASLASRIAVADTAAYTASKFGVAGFSEVLRKEALRQRVRVTTILPGQVNTDMLRGFDGPRLSPDDVANCVLFALIQPAHVNINEIVIRPLEQEL